MFSHLQDNILKIQCKTFHCSLYVSFVDYHKAFDSIHRDSLWQLLRHIDIPLKLIMLTKKSYEDLTCQVVHRGKLTEKFVEKTGFCRGCLLSPFLFLLAIDWIKKMTTEETRNGILWTLWDQLEFFDFADDLALLSYTH